MIRKFERRKPERVEAHLFTGDEGPEDLLILRGWMGKNQFLNEVTPGYYLCKNPGTGRVFSMKKDVFEMIYKEKDA